MTQASRSAADREALEALYAQYADALLHRDATEAIAHMADDFTSLTAGGSVLSRTETEARLRRSLAESTRVGPVRFDIERMASDKQGAEVTVRQLVIRTSAHWLDATATHDAYEERRVVDTWRRADGAWLLVQSRDVWPVASGSVVSATEPIASPVLEVLAKQVALGDSEAIDRFWLDLEGFAPLVEAAPGDESHHLVTFVWRGDERDRAVDLWGGLPSPGSKALTRLERTDVWYRTEILPSTARDDYGFTVRRAVTEPGVALVDITTPDPLATHRAQWSSYFELPDAPAQPHIAERAGVPRGHMTHERVRSQRLGEDRTYAVHVPAGFNPNRTDVGLIVVFDGEAYGSASDAVVPTPLIVDNLIADGLIPPSVVILVDNMALRSRDLTCSPPFFEFIAQELVPEVCRRHGIQPDPARTVAAGSSFGGLAAAYCGLRHADVFGKVLSQSGSYWAGPGWEGHERAPHEFQTGWMMDAFSASPRPPVSLWLEVGRFEPEVQVLTNRHFRSVLALRGYPVTFTEYDGGHSYTCWRGSLADGLVALLGSQRSSAVSRR